jgi:hypothetical protein
MINYFIPSDGDEEEHPNIFPMRKPLGQITLRMVKEVRARDCPASQPAAASPASISTGLSAAGHLPF